MSVEEDMPYLVFAERQCTRDNSHSSARVYVIVSVITGN